MSHRFQRSGFAIFWAVLVMVAMMAIGSLCVDWGLKTLVGSELQSAADSIAIAAAERLGEVGEPELANVRAAGMAMANANTTTGGTLNVSAADIEVGIWHKDDRRFEATSDLKAADAVRVTVERSDHRGNAIITSIGRALGVNRLASRRTAIARLEAPPRYALIGLEGFASRGVLTVDGSPWRREGHIASNGDVELNLLGLIGVSLVDGHVATLGQVRTPLIGILTILRDGIRRPPEPFTLPPVSVDFPSYQNNNSLLGTLLGNDDDLNILVAARIPAGVYYCRNFNVIAGAILHCDGPVTIYVRDNVTILGTVLALHNDPENFKIRVAGTGQVTIAANVTLSADIYAPRERIFIGAGVIYRGRLIGRRIDILGTSLFYLRPDLAAPELGRSRVTLVQ